MKQLRKAVVLLLLLSFIAPHPPVSAAPVKAGWKKKAGGFVFYNEKGKLVKATAKEKYKIIDHGKSRYAVNAKGFQVHGWRKIGKKYYYFRFGNGDGGRMVRGKTVQAVPIGKDGAAKLSSTRVKRKLALMAKFSEWADGITKKIPLASRKVKLKKIYDYLRRLPYRSVGSLRKSDPNWDIWGAEYVYKYRRFDCHTVAATFAYLANAIGCSNVTIYMAQTGRYQHGFTSVGNLYYDTSLGRNNKKSYKLFGMKRYWYTSFVKLKRNISKK